jgi:predicted GNAT superfamily acetyltransferase
MTRPDPDTLAVRDLATLEEYQACVELQDETWGSGFSERVPGAILRVGQKIGGVTAGAFDRDDRLVGFVFGLTGVRRGELVHWSDMLAVRPEWQGVHLGERLKRYQADRCRSLGVRTMLWTYDPLVAKNAHFNINRLGAEPDEYVPDMYGSNTGSALHGAMPTDRFIIAWDLTRPRAASPSAGAALEGDHAIPLANPVGADGVPRADLCVRADCMRVQVPEESSRLQQADPALGLAWRYAVREAIVPLLDEGYRVVRFARAASGHLPYYVLRRGDADSPSPSPNA